MLIGKKKKAAIRKSQKKYQKGSSIEITQENLKAQFFNNASGNLNKI